MIAASVALALISSRLKMALILRYFLKPNLVISGAYCVKVVDKAITMDNLRFLCLAVKVCRGIARRLRYKFLTD